MRTSAYQSYLKCMICFSSHHFPNLRTNISHQLFKGKYNAIVSPLSNRIQARWKSGKDDISSIVIPVPLTPANSVDDINVGEELSTKINKGLFVFLV
ncbi:ATP-dependent RNA helicase SUV3-like protein [Trichonephila inaurata madagascariensis]|uniref:ATP-dependent RNA helicase SUV3-like protein n=1 Tax=Trichonephila inaurata madagascariensis TaxID=2747483 RepID=A0A8X6XF25_9ARAC|nr:ATP-dependent RNA helicase SUV3-like protein [Trichonephila inaurata madagascariensis]